MGSVTGGEAGLIRLEIALEVEDRFGIGVQRGMSPQVLLGRDTLTGLPALPLIDAQHRRQRGGRQ